MNDQLRSAAMRGRWAEGIEPRHFHWIIKDRLAISERPGGYGSNHRPVRRLEEIIWIRQQGFDTVISLIPAPHNLHNYQDEGVRAVHRPMAGDERMSDFLLDIYKELADRLAGGEKLLVHHQELGDRIRGLVAGYLLWSGLVDSPPRAITVVEQITSRQIGPVGRELVSVAEGLPGPVDTEEK